MQTLRSDELKIELQRQMQLLEWLVAKWGFQEIARPRAELKKKLSKVDDLPLVEVQREVQSACEIFQCCSVALGLWLRDVKCRNQSRDHVQETLQLLWQVFGKWFGHTGTMAVLAIAKG